MTILHVTTIDALSSAWEMFQQAKHDCHCEITLQGNAELGMPP